VVFVNFIHARPSIHDCIGTIMKKIVILVILAGVIFGAYMWQPWKKSAQATADESKIKTSMVEARDIQFAITAAGDIGPAEQVSVRPEINGKIATLLVDIGDKLKKDDVIFTMDDTDLQTERSSSQTEIEGAQLQVEKAERNYKRSQQLFSDRLISLELFENAHTEYMMATNSLERAEKSLRLVMDKLTKTKNHRPV